MAMEFGCFLDSAWPCCFLVSSYEGQDCRTLCGVLPLPQAHEGELSILFFRQQCLVRRPVICWFGPISPMCGPICLTGKDGGLGGGGGGGSCIQQGLFFPLESLSSHIESHWHLPLLFSLSFHFLGFCSKLVSIAGQLGDIGKAFLASWSGQVTCLQLEPPRLIWCL